MSKKYDVGYRKPPVHTRFKKGKSGNPRGRPKRRLTVEQVEAALDRALIARINVAENGSTRVLSKLDVLATQTVNKGLKGHHPTAALIFSILMKRAAAEPDTHQPGRTEEERIAEIDGILAEIAGNLSTSGELPGPPNDTPSESHADTGDHDPAQPDPPTPKEE